MSTAGKPDAITPLEPDLVALPLEARKRLVQACDRLEADWYAEKPVLIDHYLEGIEGSVLPLVRQELSSLLDELERERRPKSVPDVHGALPRARFTLMATLNQGGMGVVSRAFDTELDRPVAIKEIRQGAADDPEYRARFLAEAEITSKLEHPGIIPIYSLGQYQDGRPYYAMRLIQGGRTGTLQEAIDQFYATEYPSTTDRSVRLRELLGRLIDVCNTVEYAHSQGVVHRDLKPANILLGPYGETLVVDWGLAKVMGAVDSAPSAEGKSDGGVRLSGSGASPTLHGGRIGTPGFAAPEQMMGEVDQVGPRSDVYGLGAILYCLLTGKPAFSRSGIDLDTCIQKIRRGDFPPPHAVRTNIPRPLEAICLKAMQTRPDDRYPSAQALKQDLERFLEYLPVNTYQEPWMASVRRWSARHRRPVLAGAATLALATVVGLSSVWAVQSRARADLEIKNKALADALVQTEQSRDHSREQQARAEANETMAINAIDGFRKTIVDEKELQDAPALADLRTHLLQTPLGFFRTMREELRTQTDTSPQSLDRLALSCANLASLTEEIGDHEHAIELYREALSVYEKLAPPGTINAFSEPLALVHFNLGRLLRKTGKLEAAQLEIRKSLALREELVDSQSADSIELSKLAEVYELLCLLSNDQNQLDMANQMATRSIAIRERLQTLKPEDPMSQYGLAKSYNTMGLILRLQGKFDDALLRARTAMPYVETEVPGRPRIREFAAQAAMNHDLIGLILRDQGKMNLALGEAEQARAQFQILVTEYPTNTEYQYYLGNTRQHLGLIYQSLGRTKDAISEVEQSREILKRLVQSHPTVPAYEQELASTLFLLSSLRFVAGDVDEARQLAEECRTVWEKLSAANPGDHSIRSQFAICTSNLAALLIETGDLKGALVHGRSAIGLFQALAEQQPQEPLFLQKSMNSVKMLVMLLKKNGQIAEVRNVLKTAQEHLQNRVKIAPANSKARFQLATSLDQLGREFGEIGAVDDALQSWEAALGLFRTLADENPGDVQNLRFLAAIHQRSAIALGKQEHLEQARDQLQEALTWVRKVMQCPQAAEPDRQFLISLLKELRLVCQNLGDEPGVASARQQLGD